MKQPETTSPAYARSDIEGENSLVELPWCGKINLRGNPKNTGFLRKAEKALVAKLPLQPNTCINYLDRIAYWLGPDEWCIHCPIGETGAVISQTRQALGRVHHALVDVSDYYTVLRLEGPDAEKLLAKGCPLDLHPKRFPDGACAQTRFGHASILLHRTGTPSGFNIQVRWSFTEYVWDYLASGMQML